MWNNCLFLEGVSVQVPRMVCSSGKLMDWHILTPMITKVMWSSGEVTQILLIITIYWVPTGCLASWRWPRSLCSLSQVCQSPWAPLGEKTMGQDLQGMPGWAEQHWDPADKPWEISSPSLGAPLLPQGGKSSQARKHQDGSLMRCCNLPDTFLDTFFFAF